MMIKRTEQLFDSVAKMVKKNEEIPEFLKKQLLFFVTTMDDANSIGEKCGLKGQTLWEWKEGRSVGPVVAIMPPQAETSTGTEKTIYKDMGQLNDLIKQLLEQQEKNNNILLQLLELQQKERAE